VTGNNDGYYPSSCKILHIPELGFRQVAGYIGITCGYQSASDARVPRDFRPSSKNLTIQEHAMKILNLAAVLAVGSLVPAAFAATITVTNNSSAGWVQIGTSTTYGLPANLSSIGCGTENEPTCEPVGVFDFSTTFSTSGVLNIMEATGGVSDQIHFSNVGGHGEVTFSSDPNVGTLPNGTTLCTEGVNGCIQAFTITASDGTVITLTAASDGENVFDPFGLGADSSDELQITSGAVITPTVPEPSSLILLGTGILGLAASLRRRLVK
jgi:hypothetical protein